MKKIELKSFHVTQKDARSGAPLLDAKGKEKTDEVFYKTLILGALNFVQEGGIALSEQGKRIKVIEKVENAENGTELELDDVEVDLIHQLLQGMRYGLINKGLLEFGDYITEVKEAK